MWAQIWDWHKNRSWSLGYKHGKEGRSCDSPWWVDEGIYGLAYMQGMDVNVTSAATSATDEAALAKDLLEKALLSRRRSG
jgi:hypothetical protein